MKRITQIATFVFVFTIWAGVGNACWCMRPTVNDAFERAQSVFVGEVLEVIPPRGINEAREFVKDAHTIRFRIETRWKGAFWHEASVLVRFDSCFGLKTAPQKGARYLVYAEPVYPKDESRREVMISGCTRTAPMSGVAVDATLFYANSPVDDIRILNTLIIFSSRQRPPDIPWIKFLDPDL